MIAYLSGKLAFKSPTHVFLDIGGMAYEVQVSLNTYAEIESLDTVKLFTYMIVRDDAHSLYGFYTMNEKEVFAKLISVSGIGPNTARVILSYMTADETKSAILSDNVVAFKKVKGVGPKTAQRIILDLKDKVSMDGMTIDHQVSKIDNSIRDEALSALQALGFQKTIISKHIDKILSSDNEINQVEHLIKAVLRQIS